MTAPILRPVNRWYCPNCRKEDVTHEPRPHTRFHTCPALRGLLAPMIPAGTKAKVERRDREDYVGREQVPVDDDGRPVMSVVTTRDDGTDVAMFMPTARINGQVN